MRFFILGLLILLPVVAAQAQQEDSQDVPRLLKEFAVASTDTGRILLKCRLGEAYRSNNPDTSFILATEAVSESRATGFKKGEIHGLTVLCVLYREKGDLPTALELGLKALKMAEDENLAYEQIYALVRVAVVYISVRDFPKAFTYLRKAEGLVKKNYDEFQSFAVQYFLATAYEQSNDLEAAERQMQIFDKEAPQLKAWKVTSKRLKAYIAVKRNQLPLAIKYYRESNETAIAENASREVATTCNALAVAFQKMGEIDSAIYYAKEGLRLGQMLGYTNRILAASSLLSDLYADRDPGESVRYNKIAAAARDSLYGMQKVLQLQSATMKEQERQAEVEAARIAYQNKLKQWLLLGGVAVFLVVALILYRNNRQKQKTNVVLEKTLADLRTTQSQLVHAEKMASLGELTAGIAHEIQNPLNFVNNFSEINEELLKELRNEAEKGNMDEVRSISKDIEFNSEKINHHGKRADAIVKGMLQHSRAGSGQKEPTDINALADEYLRLAYHGLRAKDKLFTATIKTDFDGHIGKINVIPQDMGRVILNLINNAFYAVNEKQKQNVNGYEPIVSLSTRTVKPPLGGLGAKIEIVVRDNGNGIPQKIVDKIFQPFFTTKPTGEGTGLGLSLAYDIIRKGHGGELKVETTVGAGSEFVISIPA